MTQKEIKQQLFALKDEKFREFHTRLIPTVSPDTVIGVRTPELRRLAKEIGEDESFLAALPHEYYEENQLHAIIISRMTDFERCIERLDKFLPYVNNWATTDIITVKLFKKHTDELLPHVKRWLASGETYTVRYAIGCLMKYYLDEAFRKEYLNLVATVDCSEYYVSTMAAWYFATALAKQYSAALNYIECLLLDPATHSRTIQKAVESHRITDEHKAYIKIFV